MTAATTAPEPMPFGSGSGIGRNFGWRADRRPNAWVGNAIAGGAGTLAGLGVLMIASETVPDDGENGVAAAAVSALLILGAYVVIRIVPALLRPGCTSMLVVGIGGVAGYLVFPKVDNTDDLRWFFLLTIAALVAPFLVGAFRGRLVLLALAALLLHTWALVEIADHDASQTVPRPFTGSSSDSGSSFSDESFPGDGSSSDFNDADDDGIPDEFDEDFDFQGSFEDDFETPDPNWGELGVLSALFGAVYLGGVAFLDRRGRRGTATALVVPGVLATATAVLLLGIEADSAAVGGLLSIIGGLACCATGATTQRRFTVWTGAFLATIGAVLISGDLTDGGSSEGDDYAGVFGLVLVAFGVVSGILAYVASRVLGEPDVDGSSEAPPPSDGDGGDGTVAVTAPSGDATEAQYPLPPPSGPFHPPPVDLT